MQQRQGQSSLLLSGKERGDLNLSKQSPKINVKTAQICEKGKGREVNQDMCYKHTVASHGDIKAIYAVADGIGSFSSSQTASSIVRDILEDWFKTALESGRLEDEPDAICEQVIENVFYRAYDEIVNEARKNKCHMGTTLSMILVTNAKCYLFHVGDSRIYLDSPDESDNLFLECLTKDDKKVDPRDNKAKLVNAIADQLPKPQVASACDDLYPDDMYILMTDGGYKRNPDPQIERMVNEARAGSKPCAEFCNRLYRSALNNGETDDITVLSVLFEGL